MLQKGKIELFVDNNAKRDEILRKILENIELCSLAKGTEIEKLTGFRSANLSPSDPSNLVTFPSQLHEEIKRRIQRC